MARVSVSTHVLDTEHGRPAAGVRVELYDAGGERVGDGVTDADGRISGLAEGDSGSYRLVFHPPSPFFTQVALEVALEDGHYHVPLLISSYGCASYRGS